jgi:Ran GTPase-activating protein (RanGAP) involved in mRNA processing and transport
MNRALKVLNLHLNQIGDEGAKALAKALERNQTLRELDLESNQIGDEGALALAEALAKNQTLTMLNLAHNKIGVEGAQALAEALKRNQKLTILHLKDNRIGDGGAQALAKALETNQTLTEMALTGCQIGDAGAQALAKALETNQTLTWLHLSRNQIGNEGAEALAKALNYNLALNTLFTDRGFLENYIDRNNRIRPLVYDRVRHAMTALKIVLEEMGVYSDLREKMAEHLWETRNDPMWRTPTESDGVGTYGVAKASTKRLKTVNSCLQCFSETPRFQEKGDASRRFCGSYCQMVLYHGFPDVRGMTPEQIKTL